MAPAGSSHGVLLCGRGEHIEDLRDCGVGAESSLAKNEQRVLWCGYNAQGKRATRVTVRVLVVNMRWLGCGPSAVLLCEAPPVHLSRTRNSAYRKTRCLLIGFTRSHQTHTTTNPGRITFECDRGKGVV